MRAESQTFDETGDIFGAGNEMRQFSELDNPAIELHSLLTKALTALVPDLADAPWLMHEKPIINRFVFGHLIPAFQGAGFDIRQIAFEESMVKGIAECLTARGDIVIWPHQKAGAFRGCKPLARIEWKNTHSRGRRKRKGGEKRVDKPESLAAAHPACYDELIKTVLPASADMATTNYAVLTECGSTEVRLFCTQVTNNKSTEVLVLRAPGGGDVREVRLLPRRKGTGEVSGCPLCALVRR